MTIKQVADLYLITYEDGKPYRYTRNANEATDAINGGFKVEEFISLENHRAAMLQGADSNSPVTPDGWKLVPVIAFPSQWAAGHKAFNSAGINKVDAVYKAMVAVAPDSREISNSSTNNCREIAESSTNCPCCGRKPLKNRACSVDGCDGKHVAHGFCKKHYDIERKKDPSRRESIRAADERYRARKSAAQLQEMK